MGNKDGLLIIPAYNEEKNISEVIKGVRRRNYNLDIVIINDGSQDRTAELARKTGEQVIDHLFNIGYGGALQTGYKYAAARAYTYVVQCDADGQHDPGDIAAILELLRTENYDIVIGSRFTAGLKDAGFFKGMAIRFFRFLIKLFTGEKITDPTSGLQGLNREAFEHYAKIGNFPEDYPDADTLIYMLKKGYRISEVPVRSGKRLAGQGMHDGLNCIYYVLKMVVSIMVVLLRCRFQKRVIPHV